MKNKFSFRNFLAVALFLLVLSVFLYIANLVVFDVVVLVLNITDHAVLVSLGTIFGVLSASFIVSSLLGMRYYNAFTRMYYYCSSVWIGFFTYTFLAAFVYGITSTVLGEPLVLFAQAMLAVVLIAIIYGIFHARRIIVTEIKISLPRLPEKWRGRKAVWFSDIHLGQIYDERFTQKIVDAVNAIPHDIVFVGGDLYDGTQAPDIERFVLPLAKFSAPLGIYFITGNHEEFGDNAKFVSAVKSLDIHILMDTMKEIDGLQIIGVDYKNAMHKKDFKKVLSSIPFNPNKPSILLKHDPKDIEVAAHAGISLQISGHTHKAQMWPLGYIAEVIYGKFVYGFHQFKKMHVYTSSGVGTWGPPMRVGSDSEIVVFTFE